MELFSKQGNRGIMVTIWEPPTYYAQVNQSQCMQFEATFPLWDRKMNVQQIFKPLEVQLQGSRCALSFTASLVAHKPS